MKKYEKKRLLFVKEKKEGTLCTVKSKNDDIHCDLKNIPYRP